MDKPIVAEQVQPMEQASTSTSRKRAAGSSVVPYEQLLSEDLRKASKKDVPVRPRTVTLGGSSSLLQVPTKLGPVLGQRFGRSV